MKKWLVWREGALASIRGDNFAMTPYLPPPQYGIDWDRWKRLEWAKGYWWADKNRCPSNRRDGMTNNLISEALAQACNPHCVSTETCEKLLAAIPLADECVRVLAELVHLVEAIQPVYGKQWDELQRASVLLKKLEAGQ